MKTIVVKTEKVVSHKDDMMPVIEVINQKISPELTFFKFVKYLPNQGYKSATVVKVLDDDKEVDEVEKYQTMIDESLKAKQSGAIDYKAESEKQAKLNAELLKRIEAIETGNKEGYNTPIMFEQRDKNREVLVQKAYELSITFRSNIGNAKLLEKIQEVEPEFKV